MSRTRSTGRRIATSIRQQWAGVIVYPATEQGVRGVLADAAAAEVVVKASGVVGGCDASEIGTGYLGTGT